MIRSKKLFCLSIVLLVIFIVLNFPYPHHYPFGEIILTSLKIPTRFADGFYTVGVFSTLILIIGLIVLVRSLEKYRGRALIITFLLIFFVPSLFIQAYEKYIAKGVYAVTYASHRSKCHYEITDEKTLHATCELHFTNESKEDVTFEFVFKEEEHFIDEMMEYLNVDAPYEVFLHAQETDIIVIETDIDLTDVDTYIGGGEIFYVNIIISANGKSREL